MWRSLAHFGRRPALIRVAPWRYLEPGRSYRPVSASNVIVFVGSNGVAGLYSGSAHHEVERVVRASKHDSIAFFSGYGSAPMGWAQCRRFSSSAALPPTGNAQRSRDNKAAKPVVTDDDKAKEVLFAQERSTRHEKYEDLLQNTALLPNKLSWSTVARALAGNSAIAILKFGVYLQTGSAAMLSEAVHTLADCGNQLLLLRGLQQSSQTPDRRYQYGYGKASFFWSLVSALGMFWTGAGVAFGHGLYTLLHPPELFEVSKEMMGVLLVSFMVDGFVLSKTLKDVLKSRPEGVGAVSHLMNVRDPFVLAVLFEDAAACTGILLAATGVYLSHLHGDVSYDTLAGISVGFLLAGVAIKLVQINHQFLVGQAVDDEIVADIRNILNERPGINAVYDIQSQWVGPHAFAFKAECDFDGYALSNKLKELYVPLFLDALKKDSDSERAHQIEIIMAWMAEDITRLIEQEVKEVEIVIRRRHPMAAFIELEPDSKTSFLRAYDGKAWRDGSENLASSLQRKDSMISAILQSEMSKVNLMDKPGNLTQEDLAEAILKREAAKLVSSVLKRKVSAISNEHNRLSKHRENETDGSGRV